MAKALKPLIIALLVLSLFSLILGIVLFAKREALKGRALKSEAAIVQVAEKIHFDTLDKEALKKYETMDGALQPLVAAADNTYETLQNTKKDLEITKTELGKTKDELAATKTELETTKNKVVELTDTIEQKDAEIVQANGRITQLEQDKSNLQMQIDDLNNQLVKSEEEMRDLQDQKNALEKALKDYEALAGGRPLGVPHDLTGKVMVVNPDWNFVVLNIGSQSGLVPNAEMLVQREDRLVGKIRISSVEKSMAVAEILRDWEQAQVEEGDNVIVF